MKKTLIRLHFILSEQFGIDPLRLIRSLRGIPHFIRDWRQFRQSYKGKIVFKPCLRDRFEEGGTTKSEYFWQDLLTARKIFHAQPAKHVDVGSRLDGFVAHVASFRDIEVFDIRPITSTIPGVIFKQADMMSKDSVADYVKENDGYCDSLSCLHAIEHFGLGRYGDPIDPQGFVRGIDNLARLLLPGGRLYLSTPIGQQRVEFNANWVFSPSTIVDTAAAAGLVLDELTVLDGQGNKTETLRPVPSYLAELANEDYQLGIFHFTKAKSPAQL